MRGQPLETFVDRIAELALLRALVAEAERGEPRVALIVGDSGLGKTSLARQLARVASEGGATVLHAACQEGLDVPYLPVATALRTLDAGSLLHVPSPSMSTLESTIESTTPTNQLRLFLEATETIRAACQQAPLVLIIDDVQWADTATLDLVSHLAASLLLSGAGVRHGLLLVLAHRPEVPPPVRRLLDRLRRHPAASALRLRPFRSAEGHALVRAVSGATPRPETLARLLERSRGNPLILHGLVERNVADGHLIVEASTLMIARSSTEALQPGASDLDIDAEERIARLSERCRAALGLAAFIGAEGSVAVLSTVLRSDVGGALRDAEAAGIVELHDGMYRFRLDEVRHHLRDRTAATGAPALHKQVADAMGALFGDEAVASELLPHLVAASPRDGSRLVACARAVGDRAFELGAWRQALDAYTLALGVHDDGGSQLHLRAGVAGFWVNDVSAGRRHLEIAASRAKAEGDIETWTEATLKSSRLAFVGPPSGREEAELAELLDATGDHPALHARALATVADHAYAALDFDRALRLATAAVDADGSGGHERSPLPEVSLGIVLLASLRLEDAERHLGLAAQLASNAGDDHTRTSVQSRELLGLVLRGELDSVDQRAPELVDEMHRRGYWADVQVAMCAHINVALLAGRFADAERDSASTDLLLDWVPYSFTAGMLMPAWAAGRALRGDHAGAARVLDGWKRTGGRGAWRYQQLVDALAGDVEGVKAELARRRWPPASTRADLFSLGLLVAQAEIGAAVADRAMVEEVLPPLRGAVDMGVTFSIGWPASLHRVIGLAEHSCGRVDDARRWLDDGLDQVDSCGARAEVAQTLLALARAEQDCGIGSASHRLRDAASLLDELGLLPLASSARRAAASSGATSLDRPRVRVVFCSDLVGSTELNVRMGDEHYVELLSEHDRILRRGLHAHGGVEFKHTGDGMFAWFADAADAVRCALDVIDEFDRWTTTRPDVPLRVRVGLAEGDPIDTGADLFGLTVVQASRLCALSSGGTAVVADEIAQGCRVDAVDFVALGEHQLKGFPAPVPVWAAARSRPG